FCSPCFLGVFAGLPFKGQPVPFRVPLAILAGVCILRHGSVAESGISHSPDHCKLLARHISLVTELVDSLGTFGESPAAPYFGWRRRLAFRRLAVHHVRRVRD